FRNPRAEGNIAGTSFSTPGRASRCLHYSLLSRGPERLRRLRVSGRVSLPHSGGKRARRGLRRLAFSASDPGPRPGTPSLPQRALAASPGSAGTSGNWTPRPADHPGLLSRPVAAASAARARMGPYRLPRTNLQESRLAAKRLANRRQAGGLHRRDLCRSRVTLLKMSSERGGSSACGRCRRVEEPAPSEVEGTPMYTEKFLYWDFLPLKVLRLPVTRWVFRV